MRRVTANTRRIPRLLILSTAGLLALNGCGGSSTRRSAQPAAHPSSASSTASSTSRGVVTATAGTSDTVSASADGVVATMHATSHHPKADRSWPVHFTVTSGGHAAAASVSYEFLLDGQVVARRSHYHFTGSFSDVVTWPVASIGYPLTFRAAIVSSRTTLYLDYPVQVSR